MVLLALLVSPPGRQYVHKQQAVSRAAEPVDRTNARCGSSPSEYNGTTSEPLSQMRSPVDGDRFDGLARRLSSVKTRRGYLAGVSAMLAAMGVAMAGNAPAMQVFCRGENEGCALNSGCCPGLVCVRTSAFNPNVGICQAGAPTSTSTPTGTRTPTPTPTVTVTPAPTFAPDDRLLNVSLDCHLWTNGTQVLSITNLTRRSDFTLTNVKTNPVQPCGLEGDGVGRRIVRPGRTRRFGFGPRCSELDGITCLTENRCFMRPYDESFATLTIERGGQAITPLPRVYCGQEVTIETRR